MKVILNEEYIKQHQMVVCDFTAHTPHVKKRKFLSRIHTKKLRDTATASQFQSGKKEKITTVSPDDDFMYHQTDGLHKPGSRWCELCTRLYWRGCVR